MHAGVRIGTRRLAKVGTEVAITLSASPMDKKLVRTSKFLALVLRHQPQQIGLSLDEGGWANVAELIERASSAGVTLTADSLKDVVAQNDKGRFSFSEDGLRIRAVQGHSLPIDLGLDAVDPPRILYHGTAKRFLEGIRDQGLTSRDRQYVHLSPDEQTARKVGRRHGEPVVLRIESGEMRAAGYEFFLSENGVWLTGEVPAQYIDFSNRT